MSADWRNRGTLLILMSIAMPLAFAVWMAVLNNFVVEQAQFTGAEIGMLHSVREIPGFLAFSAVLLLLLMTEQRLAIVSLMVLGLGVAATGLFTEALKLYLITFVMSMGFHYFEAIKQSLSLQWLPRDDAPRLLGKLIGIGAITSLLAYAAVWALLQWAGLSYAAIFALAGGGCALLAVFMWIAFPAFKSDTDQHTRLLLRKRYWLFYALTFMSGARRQIFVVFAGFLLVEKFGYSAANIALLYLVNHLISWLIAERAGSLIGRIGERNALTIEYLGLIGVFAGYAFVSDGRVAAGLYVLDHVFFALAIAIKTYFQKIADGPDIAATAGVSLSINHIAAVGIPAAFGLIWLSSPALVFLLGAGMASVSLILSRLVPRHPEPGRETVLDSPA